MTEKIDFNPPNPTNAKKKNSILKNLTDTHSTTSIDAELLTQIKQMRNLKYLIPLKQLITY